MKLFTLGLSTLLVLGCLGLSCGGDDDSSPIAPQPGTITASATSIQGQNGKYFAVGVFDFDWYPGGPNNPQGVIRASIPGDDYSPSLVVEAIDQNGDPTGEAKTFAGGAYSGVFFVGQPNSAPESFAEVRAAVDGNITVSAPAWAAWQHP